MEMKTLGKTGLKISRLGAGLAEIGSLTMENVSEAGRVLNAALDGGINFLDTAACYGNSEEMIGLTVAHRRNEFVLATKCGHATGGYTGEPWTAKTINDSIERSLARMKTDYLDLVQLHSCDLDVLERGEVVQALQKAKEAGKTRFIGYSGDNEAARWAVESGLFDTLQTSFSLVDQHARTKLFPLAKAKGVGVIIKRPIGNGVWGAKRSPSTYADQYFPRGQEMSRMGPVPGAPGNSLLLAIGFTLAHPEVDTAIWGTSNPGHMLANIELVEKKLPIPTEAVEELQRRFDKLGEQWVQLI